jgi:DNA-binding transcriptional LysR family regulator
MELRHLRYFVAVAEELHFGRAAERLGIAQPPLSQQIKFLEGEIGAPLFLRTKRHTELTAAGESLLTDARKILSNADSAVLAARRAARGESGQLVVGFVNSAVYGELTNIFRLMRQRYPDMTLVLQDLTSEEQVAAIKNHQLDVGLVRPPIADAAPLILKTVYREPLVVALPRGHRLAREKQLLMRWLSNELFLHVPRSLGPGFFDQFIRLCAQAGFAPKVVQEAHSTQTIISLVAAGMGIAIVPEAMRHFQRTGVVYRPLKPPVPTTELAAVWRPDDSSPGLKSFLEVVWEVAKVQAPAKR